MMMDWYSFSLSFALSFGLLLLLTKTNLGKFALDTPNHRSLHTQITPRTGGIAIMISLVITWFFIGGLIAWLVPVLLLATVSVLDDVVSMPVLLRFLIHIVVAAGFNICFFDMSWLSNILCVVGLVWMTNLYNFMDGSDGLAGGMAVFGFGAYAIAASLANEQAVALMCLGIVGASLAFLIFNFHPAKIFMGDSGSVSLGFLMGSIGLCGWDKNLWAWWFPILVFSPFIVDASVTLLKRALKGEKIWVAHKNHYYQQLVQSGLGHRNVALIEYTLMILCGLTAIYLLHQSKIWIGYGLLLWTITYLLLMAIVDRIRVKSTKASRPSK